MIPGLKLTFWFLVSLMFAGCSSHAVKPALSKDADGRIANNEFKRMYELLTQGDVADMNATKKRRKKTTGKKARPKKSPGKKKRAKKTRKRGTGK